ncbi:MAG TPA: molybdopterin-guanine dinucleotide biosynthesis protein MobB, partial [Gammaproteobacteria bacterium]|nr:molybdopterin-guanine dinucleotide biosynthesis protein MobB [Gammaproteobacteria bacterium]
AAEEHEPHLDELLAQLDPNLLDLVLVEGFRGEAVPKIEVHRPDLGHPPLFPDRPDIIAVACDTPPHVDPGQRSLLDLNNPEAVAGFLVQAVEHARR